MTQEPNQSCGTDSRPAEACPDQGASSAQKPANAGPHPLLDVLGEEWTLPERLELPRRVGARARRAALQARARRLEAQGELVATAAAYRELAQLCWSTGVDYAEAVRAARRVVEMVPSDPIRLELADRLEKLGAQLACAELLEATPEAIAHVPSVELRRRLGALCCRAGDAETACVHYTEVARLDPEATDALTAIGTMAGWAPEQVSRERGVVAWHEAARRFKQRGLLLEAFESIHRAFELDRASSLAAERLAYELQQLGRREAADEIWRQSAVAAGDAARHDVRVLAALDAGDLIGALGAMLDGRADSTFDLTQLLSGVEHLLSPQATVSRGFDIVLAELGCADWLAVRLESGPLLERWTDESRCHVALGRLEASYFVHLEQAREALVRAMVVHPAQAEARARLSSWATSEESPSVMLRALVQSARAAQGGLVARQLAGEIVEQHRTEPNTASLRLWAFERLQQTGHLNDGLRAEVPVLTELAASQSAEARRLEAAWSTLTRDERLTTLRTLESQLAVDPNRAIDHLAIVVALVELDPADTTSQSRYVELLDVAARLVISPTRDERLATAVALAPQLLGERGCIAQAKFYLRHGQIEQALTALLPLLDQSSPSVRGLLWLFTLARRFRDALASARALERVASAFRPAIRGTLEALAAELYLDANAPEDAARLVAGALRTNQNMSRLVTLETRLAEYTEPRSGSESIERALSRVLPNAQLCRVLASAHRRIGETDVALAWTQRALSLRPGDVELRNEQFQLALDVGDASRVVDILDDLMKQALPNAAWVSFAASALAWLTSVDAHRAVEMGRRLLDHIGGSDRSLRAALLETAQVSGDETFAVEVLERAAAVAKDGAAVHLALAERRWKCNDLEAGLLAALRAARAGAEPNEWMGYVWMSTEGQSADAELARRELSRLLLKRDERTDELAQVLRELAVMRFDLAQDTEGAVEIWCELAETGAGGWGRACRDMGEVLGERAAARRLQELCRTLAHSSDRAKVLGFAAQLSLEAGDYEGADQLIEQALQSASTSTVLLPLAERATQHGTGNERLEALYTAVEQTVLGVFGDRSLNYRAARSFEQRQAWSLALRHAVSAFETLPDDEAAWLALVRISRAAEQPQAMGHAAMRVSEATRDRGYSHRWLDRAYQQLSGSPEELRLRFDLAIRMLVGVPQVRGVRQVADCIRLMQHAGIEEVDFMRMRFERAIESLIDDLEGPDGSRLGIAMAEVAAVELGRFDIAARALLSALQADGDLEEFAVLSTSLVPYVSAGRDAFGPMLGRALDWLDRPYVHAGSEAIGLLARLELCLLDKVALLRIDQCAQRTGRGGWFRQWTDEFLADGLGAHGDGRPEAIALAATWTALDDAEFALRILARAAHEFLGHRSDTGSELALDSTWQAFRVQCEQSMERLPMPQQLATARQQLLDLEPAIPAAIASVLRVTLERRGGDRHALCSALAEQAFVGTGTPQSRVELLVEAASIAEGLGDLDGAMVYYRAAVTTQRTSVVARLGLGTLMVRMGRFRTKEQAQLLLELCTGLESSVAEEQRDLAVFLHAQALEALELHDEALRLLEDAETRVGPRALIVLGLAEQAVRRDQPAMALGYFAAALGGNLRQLRDRAEVALGAARAAAAVGDVTMALQWLEPSLEDAQTRPAALVLQAELMGAADVIEVEAASSRGQQDEPAPAASERGLGERRLGERRLGERGLGDDANTLGVTSSRIERASEPRVAAHRPPSGETVLEMLAPLATNRSSSGAGGGGQAPTADESPRMPVMAAETDDHELAVATAERLASDPEQARAWLSDGKRWLREWPLSIRLIELVQRAAHLEAHFSHEAALEQVLGIIRGDRTLAHPSDLVDQPVDIDAARSLLLRDLATPESEALALVWDGAEHEFLRDASDYDVTGVMRVVGSASPLARTYSEVVRHFGIPKTPLFYKRSSQVLSTRVLLLSPTAAMVEGDLGADESWMAYQVGSALWATIPEHSLLFGMGKDRIHAVLHALVLAFGATGGQPNPTLGESLRLAQMLWQTVRGRSQRRLKEICALELNLNRAWGAASQSLRRAGLYVCGDLRVALRAVATELRIDATLVQSNDWRGVCRAAPEMLDLFRFAVSSEYADIRWQSGRPAQFGASGRSQ